jgi:integrase/recombinase XerD
MKNDETTRYYESPFAAHMADFIRYKRAQGVKYDAVPRPAFPAKFFEVLGR